MGITSYYRVRPYSNKEWERKGSPSHQKYERDFSFTLYPAPLLQVRFFDVQPNSTIIPEIDTWQTLKKYLPVAWFPPFFLKFWCLSSLLCLRQLLDPQVWVEGRELPALKHSQLFMVTPWLHLNLPWSIFWTALATKGRQFAVFNQESEVPYFRPCFTISSWTTSDRSLNFFGFLSFLCKRKGILKDLGCKNTV